MSTTTRPLPAGVLRDMPLGPRGRRGRLIQATPNGPVHRFVFYRGTTAKAAFDVAALRVEALRELFDMRPDVERRAGQSRDLAHAIGSALDLPAADPEVRRLVDYLEALEPPAPSELP